MEKAALKFMKEWDFRVRIQKRRRGETAAD
jgi:hypothetical protein